MRSAHQLIPVSDLRELNLVEESFGYYKLQVSESNPLGKRAVFKCKDTSISEVFGYLLAQLLGVPVAEFQGVWFEKEVKLPGGYVASANHLGILIEVIPNLCLISMEQLATRDKALVAKLLSFYFFARYEWPQAFCSPTSSYVLDLERIGPVMLVDELECTLGKDIGEELSFREDEYSQTSQDYLKQILCYANELHVEGELCEEFQLISRISRETFQQNLAVKGHPYSHLLSSSFLSAVTKRQEAISQGRIGTRPSP